MESKKIALITGITGQDGSYLAEYLLELGYEVHGIIRRTSSIISRTRIDHLYKKLILYYGDVTDPLSVLSILQKIINNNKFKSLEIYNLAAQSHVAISFNIPHYTTNVDAIGVINILEAINIQNNTIKQKIKFYQAGSSEMYGKVLEIPQNEKTPFNPVSPYAAGKVYGFNITKIYRESYKIFAVNGILFNHESPRRGENFVTMKIIKGIKDIISKKQEYITLGNLYSRRDWGHAKDYVKGMWLMLQQEEPDDYVLSTGETYTVKEFVEKSFQYVGLTIKWKGGGIEEKGYDNDDNIRVVIDPIYYRPIEVDLLIGDSTKANKKLEWKREFNSLELLIKDMFSL